MFHAKVPEKRYALEGELVVEMWFGCDVTTTYLYLQKYVLGKYFFLSVGQNCQEYLFSSIAFGYVEKHNPLTLVWKRILF